MIFFTNAALLINGSGFTATSVNLNQNINLDYPKTNNNYFCNQSVTSREFNQISITNTRTTSGLQNNITNFIDHQNYPSGVFINFAGLSGIFYMSSCSISLNPTEAVSYTYVLDNYLLSGQVRPYSFFSEALSAMLPDYQNAEDYAWKSIIKNREDLINTSVNDLSYKISYNVRPKYFLGNTNLSRIDYLGAAEQLSFTTTGISRIALDETLDNINIYTLEIYNFNNQKTSSLNLSGFKIKEKNISDNGQSYLTCNIQAERVL